MKKMTNIFTSNIKFVSLFFKNKRYYAKKPTLNEQINIKYPIEITQKQIKELFGLVNNGQQDSGSAYNQSYMERMTFNDNDSLSRKYPYEIDREVKDALHKQKLNKKFTVY